MVCNYSHTHTYRDISIPGLGIRRVTENQIDNNMDDAMESVFIQSFVHRTDI